jgi:hypothetical protein
VEKDLILGKMGKTIAVKPPQRPNGLFQPVSRHTDPFFAFGETFHA